VNRPGGAAAAGEGRGTSATAVAFAHSPDYVQSLHRGLAVIRVFDSAHASMTLSEVAARARLSRAVARRLLLTLEYLGYVDRRGRQFSLTPRILELGFSYLSSLNVAMLAQPYMEDVSRQIDESLERWLRGLRPVAATRFTLTDRGALRAALERVRAHGYAYVEQELQEGLCSMAVAVRDGQGHTVAALNAGMPFRVGARAHAQKKVLPALRAGARHIERSLSGSPATLAAMRRG
jgi:IclR family transcriptional regulator, pca regulon regulatory protein